MVGLEITERATHELRNLGWIPHLVQTPPTPRAGRDTSYSQWSSRSWLTSSPESARSSDSWVRRSKKSRLLRRIWTRLRKTEAATQQQRFRQYKYTQYHHPAYDHNHDTCHHRSPLYVRRWHCQNYFHDHHCCRATWSSSRRRHHHHH